MKTNYNLIHGKNREYYIGTRDELLLMLHDELNYMIDLLSKKATINNQELEHGYCNTIRTIYEDITQLSERFKSDSLIEYYVKEDFTSDFRLIGYIKGNL